MAGLWSWWAAIERWGSQSDRRSWLLVYAVVGAFASILIIAGALAAVFLLPAGTLSL